MSEKQKCKHIIIPCSGIGKSLGTVARRATYIVTEKKRSTDTKTICLPLLTISDQDTVIQIQKNPCITIDGCPAHCAKKNVMYYHGNLKASLMITDIMKENPTLKPKTILDIGEEGEKLAHKTAEKIVQRIDDNHGS